MRLTIYSTTYDTAVLRHILLLIGGVAPRGDSDQFFGPVLVPLKHVGEVVVEASLTHVLVLGFCDDDLTVYACTGGKDVNQLCWGW